MYSDGCTENHCTEMIRWLAPVIIGDRPVFPLQKAFCDALVGRDAVWALSTLPFLFPTFVLELWTFLLTQDRTVFCTDVRCILTLFLAMVSVCF